MADVPGVQGPAGARPPKWIKGVQGETGTDTTDGTVAGDSIAALRGFGVALGYWLPTGINRATAASRRMTRGVS